MKHFLLIKLWVLVGPYLKYPHSNLVNWVKPNEIIADNYESVMYSDWNIAFMGNGLDWRNV